MKTNKMRKSSNVRDFRNNRAAQDAHNLANQVQRALDVAYMKLGSAEIDGRPEARKTEVALKQDIDSVGTKGKGRVQAGSKKIERILRAYENDKWWSEPKKKRKN